MPEGDDAGASERGDVDHGLRLEALRIGQRVAQDQPALGVGVQDLDRLPGKRGDHVAWPAGVAARHVLAGRRHADHVDRRLHRGQRAYRAENARGARHVELHLVHLAGGLERDAAGIESDALADQNHRPCALSGAGIAQHDELRRLVRGPRHREHRPHAELFHVAALEHVDAELELARDLFRLVGEVGRGAEVGGQISQVARERRAVGGRSRLGQGLFELGIRRKRKDHRDERRVRRLLLRLELVEAVEGFARGEHRLAHVPGARARADLQVRQEQRRVLGPQLLQRGCCGPHRVAERGFREFLALAEADQQNPLGGDAGQAAQQKRRPGLARKVAQRRAHCAF